MKTNPSRASRRLAGAVFVAEGMLAFLLLGGPAQALTMQECSAQYRAAKAAKNLNGMSWNDFRKSQCSFDAPAPPTAAPSPSAQATPGPSRSRPAESQTKAAGASTWASTAVFPSAISPKYASESPGKARMHTCLDQYKLNQTTKANGGLSWIMKGGGYYSECNKRLKK